MSQIDQPSWAKHLDFTAIDLLALTGAFTLAYRLKFGDFGYVRSNAWVSLLVILLLVDIVFTLLTSPYSGVLRRSYWEDVGANLRLALLNFLAASVVFYLMKPGQLYSREMVLTTFIAYPAASIIIKAAWKQMLLSRRDNRPADSVVRMVLVTARDRAEECEQLVYAEDLASYEIVGFCLIDGEGEAEHLGRPASGVAGLPRLVSNLGATEVLVVTSQDAVRGEVLERLAEDGVRVRFAIDEALGFWSEKQSIGRAGTMKTLDLERYTFGSDQLLYLPIKRFFDVVFGLLGCLLVVPVALGVKIAYLACGDTHSIFYIQRRVGLNGRQFDLLKFRSMVWNADEVLAELLEDPEFRKQWESDQKLVDDPRITGVGRFIRRTSLDEFPQFINVLKGDMSVVGPRPLVPGELEDHGGRMLYNKVKPGITGWWACNGRSNIGYRERLELEYHYVRHCSLYLDMLCVFRTALAVLSKDGAV